MGDLKQMTPDWIVGVSLRGYGVSLAVGLGIPIPVLNEEMAAFTGVADEDILVPIVDYGNDYPNGINKNYGFVTYEALKNGHIPFNGKEVPTVPLSSVAKAREIASTLKEWILNQKFCLGEPQFTLPVE
jgi:uncharacterized protein (DUF39 family)